MPAQLDAQEVLSQVTTPRHVDAQGVAAQVESAVRRVSRRVRPIPCAPPLATLESKPNTCSVKQTVSYRKRVILFLFRFGRGSWRAIFLYAA